jgi:ATP-dependent RNA circularization protein (DNA/RNA ligase family)
LHKVFVVVVGPHIGSVCATEKASREFVDEVIARYKKENKGVVIKDEDGNTVIDYVDWESKQRLMHITVRAWDIRLENDAYVAC